jgi:hypothetical protein
MFLKSELAERSTLEVLESERRAPNSNNGTSRTKNVLEKKCNIYDSCLHLALQIIFKMSGSDEEFDKEIGIQLIQCFIKHLRMHMHKSTKGFSCFISVH